VIKIHTQDDLDLAWSEDQEEIDQEIAVQQLGINDV
jgi:hypothetical protein